VINENQAKINCPVFQRQEFAISDITGKINNARNVSDKAELAEELQEDVDALLSCPDYDQELEDCTNCRFISNLRKKTAGLLIKAKKLS
jgi:hypothetical protein